MFMLSIITPRFVDSPSHRIAGRRAKSVSDTAGASSFTHATGLYI